MRPVPELPPTTMLGSYPRPRWFTHRLHGRDVFEAFNSFPHTETCVDVTRAALEDQEQAGLDLVTDGQKWFDDDHIGIGSFFWYRFERIGDLRREKLPHPLRLAHLWSIAQGETERPVKACVGAGAVQLSTPAHFESGPVRNELMGVCT